MKIDYYQEKYIKKTKTKKGLDYREGEKLSWCPSWSNSLWQGGSCGLVHCPGGNTTDPIWRVLASSLGISSWTPLKPQHSNPNPNPLANQFCCIDFLTPPTPLIIPHRLPAFLESLIPHKNWCSIHARWSKSSLKHSIRFCGIFSKFKTQFEVFWLLYVGLLGYVKSDRNNFGKFIHQFQFETKIFIRELERTLLKLYRQNTSLAFNKTYLNERLLPNHTHIHIYTRCIR